MTTPRVLCELMTDTELRATQIRDAIQSDLIGKNVRRSGFGIGLGEILWSIVGDIEFNVESDSLTWMGQVVNRWTTGGLANRILVGSRIHRHRCPHPDGEESYNCHDDPRALYVEETKV